MPFLPIAERELRVAARRRSIYRVRFWAVAAACILFLWRWMGMRMGTPSASQGHELFLGLTILAFFFALSSGIYTTSDCLSAEKREGTMGLLFLTDLKGYDIVVGKLVASSLGAAYGLVAIIPILAVPLLLGGVSMIDLMYAVIAIGSMLFLSLAAGMVASVHNRNERQATFYTIFILFLVIVVPLLAGFLTTQVLSLQNEKEVWKLLCFSPAVLLIPISGSSWLGKEAYWFSLTACWGWTLLFLAWVSFRLPSTWQDKGSLKKAMPEKRIAHIARRRNERKKLRALLDISPFLWLSFRAEKKRTYVWAFLAAMATIWLIGYFNYTSFMMDIGVLSVLGLLLNTFLKIWVISEACQQLIEARRSGALELLLSTPLTHQKIVRGQWLALLRQFGWPLAIVFGIELLMVLVSGTNVTFLVTCIVFLPIDFFAAGWIGMWLGLTGKNTTRAILKAVVLLLVLPWIVFYLSGLVFGLFHELISVSHPMPVPKGLQSLYFGCLSLAFAYLLGFQWARKHLLSRFRSIAAGQYHSRTTED